MRRLNASEKNNGGYRYRSRVLSRAMHHRTRISQKYIKIHIESSAQVPFSLHKNLHITVRCFFAFPLANMHLKKSTFYFILSTFFS